MCSMKKDIYYLVSLLMLCICPVIGQTPAGGFERIVNNKVNEEGTALTYFIKNADESNLVLHMLHTNKEYVFENVTGQTILSDSFLFFINKEKQLHKVNLHSGSSEIVGEADRIITKRGSDVAFVFTEKESELFKLDLKNGRMQLIAETKKYFFSPNMKNLVYLGRDGKIIFFNLVKSKRINIANANTQMLKAVSWDNHEDMAYLIIDDQAELKILKIGSKLAKVVEYTIEQQLTGFEIDPMYRSVKWLSKDFLIVGLKRSKINTSETNEVSEVWLGSSKGITPTILKNQMERLHLGIISLKERKISPYYGNEFSNFTKIGRFDNQVFTLQQQDDLSKHKPDATVFRSTVDGKKFSLMGDFSNTDHSLYDFTAFPYIFYMNRAMSKIIDVQTGQSYGLPNQKSSIIENKINYDESVVQENVINYKDKRMLLQYKNQVWTFDVKNKELNLITKDVNGRYQILNCNYEAEIDNWSLNQENVIRNYDDVLLNWSADDYSQEGLVLLTDDFREEKLLSGRFRFTQVQRSKGFISFIKENSQCSPALYYYDIKNRKEKRIYQSNIWDEVSARSETVYFKSKKNNLGAIIRYPVNYDKNKKYPAVVNIYEMRIHQQNNYTSPYQLSGAGFNYHDYVTDNYFVVEPDIKYEIGNTGISANECVDKMLDEILEHYPIDPNKLGLIGHSFGGYQTSFIVTKNHRFKAAVASAGVTDLSSYYFSFNWSTMKPEFWRMENDQLRMGKTVFEIPELYKMNSPVQNAVNVKTPLLLWTGMEDYHVNFNQSVQYFLALKKLNKDVNLILYKNQKHVLTDEKSKSDAKFKVKSWFDYYLKEGQKPEWLIEGLN